MLNSKSKVKYILLLYSFRASCIVENTAVRVTFIKKVIDAIAEQVSQDNIYTPSWIAVPGALMLTHDNPVPGRKRRGWLYIRKNKSHPGVEPGPSIAASWGKPFSNVKNVFELMMIIFMDKDIKIKKINKDTNKEDIMRQSWKREFLC